MKQLSRVLASVLPLLLTGFVVFAVRSAEATSGTLAPGHLDPSFGKRGQVITGLGAPSGARAVVIQRDGKIVAAGTDYTLVRYKRNGSLDSTFGSKGKVKTSFGPGPPALAWALALQRDGKIIAVGTAESTETAYFAVARYKSDGSLDRSFGSGGKVETAFGNTGSAANAWAVAVQPDGKILVGGEVFFQESGHDQNAIALARYRSDGTLDPSFGSGGKVMTPIGSFPARGAKALALQQDGKIVVAGARKDDAETLFALVRYGRNGSLDPSFGSGGLVTTALGSIDGASDVLVQRNGRIVAVGDSGTLGQSAFALARYRPDGSLDPSFGSRGKVRTSFGGGNADPTAAALQADGKIVLVGWLYKYPNWAFALARYRADGRLDPGFGVGGKVTTSFRKLARTPANRLHQDGAWAVAIQRDGKIVAAGEGALVPAGRQNYPYKFELARYIGSGGKDGKDSLSAGAGIARAAKAKPLEPRTLVTEKGPIHGFAQDGNSIAWIGRSWRVHVRRLGARSAWDVGKVDQSNPIPGSVITRPLALAGTRVLWTTFAGGAGWVYTDVGTGAPGMRQVFVNEYQIWAPGPNETPVPGVVGDGATLAYGAVIEDCPTLTSIPRDCPELYSRPGSGVVVVAHAYNPPTIGGIPPPVMLALSQGRFAVVPAASPRPNDGYGPRPVENGPVDVYDLAGRLLSTVHPTGNVRDVALAWPTLSVIVERPDGTTALERYDARARKGTFLAPARQISSAATDLAASEVGTVFRVGSRIYFRHDRLGFNSTIPRSVRKAKSTPIGLSIEGHRIAWAGNVKGLGRVVALTVP